MFDAIRDELRRAEDLWNDERHNLQDERDNLISVLSYVLIEIRESNSDMLSRDYLIETIEALDPAILERIEKTIAGIRHLMKADENE